jgi:8-oxo-dGTP diphosphatase
MPDQRFVVTTDDNDLVAGRFVVEARFLKISAANCDIRDDGLNRPLILRSFSSSLLASDKTLSIAMHARQPANPQMTIQTVQQIFRSYDPTNASAPKRERYCAECRAPLEHIDRNVSQCNECGARRYQNPLPGVSVLIVSDDRFLLCKRRAQAFKGSMWCLPCGFIDYDEDFISAAKREVLEETALDVELASILTVSSNFFNPNTHSIVVTVLAHPTVPDQSARPGDDIEELAWHADPLRLPEMAFDGDTHIIRRYFANRFHGAPIQRQLR